MYSNVFPVPATKIFKSKATTTCTIANKGQPNVKIHADLFGPMIGVEKKSVYILCITDAFTKYAVVTKINNRTLKQ
jgi:hypothetical protein